MAKNHNIRSKEVILMFHSIKKIGLNGAAPHSALPARLFMTVLFLLVMSHLTSAQVLYGSLTGNVADASGAVVTGAKVEASNVNTGTTKTAVTNERGVFL